MPRAHVVPAELRVKLAKPMGRLFIAGEVWGPAFEEAVKKASLVITVGDKVTETLARGGRTPDVQVVDSLENRKLRSPPDVTFLRLIPLENPAGTITEEAVAGIEEAIRGLKPVRLLVKGEEDLLAIPAVAFAPESAVIFYGQPGVGIVAVRADAQSRTQNKGYLDEIGVPRKVNDAD